MRIPILLLSLLVPLSLAAQSTSALLPKQDELGWYRTSHNYREGSVIRRKNLSSDGTLDKKAQRLYCMIPPAADWVLDSGEEYLEKQYLQLIARSLHLDAISRHEEEDGGHYYERNTGVVGFCGSLRSPTPRVDLDRINTAWRKVCQYPVKAMEPGRFTCTKYSGGRVYQPKIAIVQSLNILARSSHEKTAARAMRLMEDVKSRDKYFVKTVSEVLLDPKTPIAARERAAEVLASLHTHDLSGITLATIWNNEGNSESLRRAALRGYSLVLSFGDRRSGSRATKNEGGIRDRLRDYLPGLASLIQAETREDEDGKDVLTPLGTQARCVAEQYSKRWLCYAKRFGANWYEVLKKDEAAGRNECTSSGKLKR